MSDWGEPGTAGPDAVLESHPEPELGVQPGWYLLAAGAAAVVAMLTLPGGIVLNLLGYAASSLAVFSLVALFRRVSVRRSAQLGISPPRNLNLAALGLLAIGFALSLAHAWLIASHFS